MDSFSRVSTFWNKKGLESCYSFLYATKKEKGSFMSWWTQPSPGDGSIQEMLWCDGNRLCPGILYKHQSFSPAPHTHRSHSQDLEARSHGRSCLTTQEYISQMDLKPSHHHRALNAATNFFLTKVHKTSNLFSFILSVAQGILCSN